MDAREPSMLASSEGPGMIVAPNSYGSGAGVTGHSMVMTNSTGMRFPVTSMISSIPKPPEASGMIYAGDVVQGMRPGGIFNMVEPMKKKRGRSRKYGPDGSMALALCQISSKSDNCNTSLSEPTAKRRGRPQGSGKKQQLDALGFCGTAFTPHVITVKAGEDVASKIMAFSQQGPRTVCILSANGAICNVTLRQTATSGGTVTYEGRFEIISLSGSYLLTENDGARSRNGGLSVALAGSDGRVVGGGVAGMLMAATPVQVVVGSFIEKKPKPDALECEPSSAPAQVPGFAVPSANSSPPSQGSLSESDERRSPANDSSEACNNSGHHLQGVPSYSVGWVHSGNLH